MTLLSILFALLAFFVVRWGADAVLPDGKDKDKIGMVAAIIVAILVATGVIPTTVE